MSEENSNQVNEERAEKKGGKPKVNPKFRGTMEPEVKIVGEPKPKKAAKPRVVKSGSRFVLLKELEDTTKMPQQCKQIVGILSAAEGKAMLKEDLLTAMTPVISTRQPIERILGFYQSRLVSGNWVRIEAIVNTPPVSPEARQIEGTEQGPTE